MHYKTKFETFIEYIEQWPANKLYTPINFHPSFETLYQEYHDAGETNEFRKKAKRVYEITNRVLNDRSACNYLKYIMWILLLKPVHLWY
jgi:hypothetical protein